MKQSLYKPIDIVLDKLIFPGYISPKIDGVRGAITQFGLMKKNFTPFENKNIQEFISSEYRDLLGLLSRFDCEITVGDVLSSSRLCADTAAFLLSKERPVPDSLKFHVHDLAEGVNENKTFTERIMNIADRLSFAKDDYPLSDLLRRIVIVRQIRVETVEELMSKHRDNVFIGFEGSVYKPCSNIYRFKRATPKESFFRLKDFVQEDAVIEEIKEGKGIKTGMVGSFVCTDVKTKKRIIVGAGVLLDNERTEIFTNKAVYIGKRLSYKYMNYGIKDKPRFPTFVHFRVD